MCPVCMTSAGMATSVSSAGGATVKAVKALVRGISRTPGSDYHIHYFGFHVVDGTHPPPDEN
jgi:hypothetical protein